MTKLCYKCHYDGNKCDQVIPKVHKDGEIELIDKEVWDEEYCQKCERNYSVGKCWGIITFEIDGKVE